MSKVEWNLSLTVIVCSLASVGGYVTPVNQEWWFINILNGAKINKEQIKQKIFYFFFVRRVHSLPSRTNRNSFRKVWIELGKNCRREFWLLVNLGYHILCLLTIYRIYYFVFLVFLVFLIFFAFISYW